MNETAETKDRRGINSARWTLNLIAVGIGVALICAVLFPGDWWLPSLPLIAAGVGVIFVRRIGSSGSSAGLAWSAPGESDADTDMLAYLRTGDAEVDAPAASPSQAAATPTVDEMQPAFHYPPASAELPAALRRNQHRRTMRAVKRAEDWLLFASLELNSARSDGLDTDDLRVDLDEAVEELRLRQSITRDDNSIDTDGVAVRLQRLCAHNRQMFAWEDTVRATAPNPVGLSGPVEQAFLDIAAEALENTGRHADAEAVAVSWAIDGGVCELVVRDNGAGFAPGSTNGAGLSAMRETASAAGFEFEVESVMGKGTSVTARLSPR